MEKFLALETSNEKVSNSSPPDDDYDDLHLSILSKLPLKSLKRFGCVRKSWSRLFEYPYFMTMFRNNFISSYRCSDEYLILHLAIPTEFPCTFYSLSSEEEGFEKLTRLDPPDPIPENFVIYRTLYSSSINGILCLCEHLGQTVLWNPVTKEVKLIPPSPFRAPPGIITCYNVHGFGYDHVTDDYKLLRNVYFYRQTPSEDLYPSPFWEIYSVASNSFRKLDNSNVPYFSTTSSHVYTNGVCHWLFSEDNNQKDNIQDGCLPRVIQRLASFDLSNEVTFNTPLPPEVAEVDDMFHVEPGLDLRSRSRSRSRLQWLRDSWLHLVALNGSITSIHYHKQITVCTVSILGELGGKEPWTKLFVIGPLPFDDYPLGVGKELEIFFRANDGQLARFDFRTQMICEFGLKVAKFGKIIIYEESFLPITNK